MKEVAFSWSWISGCVVTIALWELVKRLFQYLFLRPRSADAGAAGRNFSSNGEAMSPSVDALSDFDDIDAPNEPHVEVVMDPPFGLGFSNPKELYKFENDVCRGTYIFMHPPLPGGNAEGPNGINYAEYFGGKSRLWEVRVQLQFKKAPSPTADLFFGVELDAYVPLNMATRHSQNMCTSAIRQAVGGVYQSPGDDPSKTKGEAELPVCVLPMWAFDQFIVTAAGDTPPSLADPAFPNLGTKRFKRVAEYKKEVDSLLHNLNESSTYTFAFWGVSRFLDIINWMVIGIPVVTPIDFNKFAGRPPVRVVFYGMEAESPEASPAKGKPEDKRHLQSKKCYYFRAAIWSSCKRPARSRVDALLGRSPKGDSFLGLAKKRKSLRKRWTSFLKHSIAEPVVYSCTTR